MKYSILIYTVVFAASMTAAAQHHEKEDPGGMKDCPMEEQSTQQHDHDLSPARQKRPVWVPLEHRGNQGMGFAQDKTTHHFLLRKGGGVIQVTANSADDQAGIGQIRMHLKHISRAFQSGDFNIPMFVHDQTAPGVPAMTRLKAAIRYKYEEAANGGSVVISSHNPEAVQAVHEFLRFQIKEHKTGDKLEAN